MVRLAAGGWPRTWAGLCKCWGSSDPDCCIIYVLIRLFFSGLFYSRNLYKKEETMVFEAHCMSFPCTELLLFNYAKVKSVFHSMAPLSITVVNFEYTTSLHQSF